MNAQMKKRYNGVSVAVLAVIVVFGVAFVAALLWSLRTDPVALPNTFGMVACIPLLFCVMVIYARYRKDGSDPWKTVSNRGVMIISLCSLTIFLIMTVVAYFEMSFSRYLLSVIVFGVLYSVMMLILSWYVIRRRVAQRA